MPQVENEIRTVIRIADLAGGGVAYQARQAATAIARVVAADMSIGIKLLAEIKDVFVINVDEPGFHLATRPLLPQHQGSTAILADQMDEFLPISMPVTATSLLSFWDMACSIAFLLRSAERKLGV